MVMRSANCRGVSRNCYRARSYLSSLPSLRSRFPLHQLRGVELFKLFQWSPGQSPSRKEIWCTLRAVSNYLEYS